MPLDHQHTEHDRYEHQHHERHQDAGMAPRLRELALAMAHTAETIDVRVSHEFTVVLVVFALLAHVRLLLQRMPGFNWLKDSLTASTFYPAVDIARSAALAHLAGIAHALHRSGCRR